MIKQAFERALYKGKPYDLELKFIRADGKKLWVRTIGNPEIKNGAVVRISGNFMDISRYKRLQQENERVLDLLENVYASLEEAVFVVNAQSRVIVSCNDAAERVFGFEKNEMIGRNTELIHVNKKQYQEFAKKLIQAFNTKGIFQCEFSMRKKDGTIFPTAHTVKELRTSSGSSILRVSVVRDITFEKMATEKLINRKNELKKTNRHLDEVNTALRVLLEQREKDKKNLEEQMKLSVSELMKMVGGVNKAGTPLASESYKIKDLIHKHLSTKADKAMAKKTGASEIRLRHGSAAKSEKVTLPNDKDFGDF